MKTWLLRIGLGVGAVVAVVVALSGYFLIRTGALRSFPTATAACTEFPLQGESAEDIVVDRVRNLAYISARNRRGAAPGASEPGTVKVIDMTATPWRMSVAVTGAPADFRPHGLSLFTDADGRQTLMAISHPGADQHRVEIFDRAEDGSFAHVQSVGGAELFKPNDLAAVGSRQFYVVNDTGARTPFQRAAEQLFGAGYSSLVYYDGAALKVMRDDLASPGGLNVAADGARLFVAETQGKRVTILKRDPATGALANEASIALAGLPDNIDIAADGAAWVTSHGSALGLVRHFIDPAQPSPSVVNRIAATASGGWDAPEVYVSDGRNLSAGSVTVQVGNQMLLGSITEYKILVCKAP